MSRPENPAVPAVIALRTTLNAADTSPDRLSAPPEAKAATRVRDAVKKLVGRRGQ